MTILIDVRLITKTIECGLNYGVYFLIFLNEILLTNFISMYVYYFIRVKNSSTYFKLNKQFINIFVF